MKKTQTPRKTLAPGIARVLKRLHYPLDVILLCVRWYVAYSLSLRNLENMMTVLAQFRRWLGANSIGLLPQAPRAKALGNALRHWEALVRYTENGVLLPDTNYADSRIMPRPGTEVATVGGSLFRVVCPERDCGQSQGQPLSRDGKA